MHQYQRQDENNEVNRLIRGRRQRKKKDALTTLKIQKANNRKRKTRKGSRKAPTEREATPRDAHQHRKSRKERDVQSMPQTSEMPEIPKKINSP